MSRGFRWSQWWPFVPGVVCGIAMAWAARELPYRDWRAVVTPVEYEPLIIRHDAKGDGHFGAPRSGNRRHLGVDVEAPLDAPVRAIRSGSVLAVGTHRGLGRYVELEHAHGVRSLYGHLNTISVDVGERVRQGQRIATVGKTGNAKHPAITPHLHVEILRGGEPLDPADIGLAFLEPSGGVSGTAAKMPEEASDEAQADGGE